ncbi:MerR family transcriptional regulator [Leucobacter insecticola]|uniref:MerR family transcriptional regulator n=1 Tax=Leucobacter insecticola TaxID=2714934 RepID=A0A6G8FIZ5_9MICO|nr:MerR family transcriptional regulator [Leucobacter insecticola]QIM16032.1 MerR family transcriptional regulator [Leucobacter insecticola]
MTPQTIRNWEADGALPRAERTTSGYRRYDENHVRAARAYRALSAGHGPAIAHEVMTLATAGGFDEALARLDASHAVLHCQRRELHDLSVALHSVLDDAPLPAPTVDRVSIGELAKMLGVKTSTLRVWEDAGLLSAERDPHTQRRSYTEPQMHIARIIRLLRQGGYLFERISPIVVVISSAGSLAALERALDERSRSLSARSRQALNGAAELHNYAEQLASDGAGYIQPHS